MFKRKLNAEYLRVLQEKEAITASLVKPEDYYNIREIAPSKYSISRVTYVVTSLRYYRDYYRAGVVGKECLDRLKDIVPKLNKTHYDIKQEFNSLSAAEDFLSRLINPEEYERHYAITPPLTRIK